jgi:hypothetical protein
MRNETMKKETAKKKERKRKKTRELASVLETNQSSFC